MTASLSGVEVCVFDAYGTVFDFASAASRCGNVPPDKMASLTTLWRDKQLQYAWLRALQGRHADFWQVTGDALDYALETLGLASDTTRARLMQLYLELEVFPEVPAVLERLKRAGKRVGILSNGSPAMLAAAVRSAKIEGLLDTVLSVEEAGVYKPHPKVYALAANHFAVAAGAITFQSSNAWDAHAASAYGMRVVWCNRYGQRRERLPGKPDHEVRSLAELPALLGVN